MNENRGRVGYEATFEKDDYSRIPWERCCEDVKKYWNTVYDAIVEYHLFHIL